eukprot:scaffold41478_cov183-Skeletonema_dohrnii-CCMP3373.AAC.1
MMKAVLVAGIIALPTISSAFVSPHSRCGQHFHVGINDRVAESEHIFSTRSTKLNLFGNLFGNEVADVEAKELARFSNLLVSSDTNVIDVKFDSLSIMISS